MVHNVVDEKSRNRKANSLMGQEVDLLAAYPKTPRSVQERFDSKSEEHKRIASEFGKEFFDGERSTGYGGFHYSPKFWTPVIPSFIAHWGLSGQSSLLDVGCAKGFMLYDLSRALPGIRVRGIDISEYAIENAKIEIASHVSVANAIDLPFEDGSFDVVISINTIHNLDLDECAMALMEIERVSNKGAFVTVDAYRDDAEYERMMAWNLTAKTILSVDEWKKFFREVGYSGDYYWFIP